MFSKQALLPFCFRKEKKGVYAVCWVLQTCYAAHAAHATELPRVWQVDECNEIIIEMMIARGHGVDGSKLIYALHVSRVEVQQTRRYDQTIPGVSALKPRPPLPTRQIPWTESVSARLATEISQRWAPNRYLVSHCLYFSETLNPKP